ncbi:MAG: methyltransferase domain-containing protein [bacterium]
MLNSKDVFGRALLAQLWDETANEYSIERDDGRIEALPLGAYFENYESSPFYLAAAKHVRGRALDIGCGAGKALLYFQGEKVSIVGVDISPGALSVSRLRGVEGVGLGGRARPPLPGELLPDSTASGEQLGYLRHSGGDGSTYFCRAGRRWSTLCTPSGRSKRSRAHRSKAQCGKHIDSH